jgi:gliding motility-associated-like protein
MGKIFASLAIGVVLCSSVAQAQLVYNNGGLLHVDVGGVLHVNGDFENDQSGNFENYGDVTVTSDVTFSNVSNTFGDGLYHIKGDWINDAIFTADNSEVELYGDNQLIDGSVQSDFYDLTLIGGGVKTLDIDATSSGILDLTDRELGTEGFVFTSTSTSVGAIVRTSGFVSSTLGGSLNRNTAFVGTYLFPTGSSLGTVRYRPIEIQPNSASANEFSVRLVNHDATSDSYDRSLKDLDICAANPDWYHIIDQEVGADDIDLTIYHDDVLDGEYKSIAQWEALTTNQWETVGPTMLVAGSLIGVRAQTWSDFTTEPYILTRVAPNAPLAGGDDVLCGGGEGIYQAWGDPSNTYNWVVTGGVITSADVNSDVISVAWGLSPTGTVEVYQVENGCPSVLGATVNVSLLAQPDADYVYQNINQSLSDFAFTDSSVGIGLGYQWSFGDGETSVNTNPMHSYDSPGEYLAQLIIENEDGCLDTIMDTIVIMETFEMPDIFSPNNDGWNDKLMANAMGICNFNIGIYNRWGELVYETINPRVAWDGTTKSGEQASEGTYYYVLKGVSCADESFLYDERKYITLVRTQD